MKKRQSTTKERAIKPGKDVTPARITGGVDVGKSFLDAAIDGPTIDGPTSKALRQPNTPQGHAAIVEFFITHAVGKVGIEASGSYEFEIADAMRQAGLEVIVFQPAQVRAYARFLNLRVKTDPIDAALIARCAALRQEGHGSHDPRLAAFAEHLTFIDQIAEDIARLRTRLERFRDERLIGTIKQDIARLRKLQGAERANLRNAVCAHADLDERYRLLISIEGLGEPTALTLVIRMPELGRLTREQAASLAGMAPFTQQSGRWVGQAHVAGGRGRVGRAIFAAAQAASQRWNKALVDFYQRLRASGKHHSLAVVACARKLIVYANTVLQRGTPWMPQS